MAPILASYPLQAHDQHKLNGFNISAGCGRTSHSRSTSAGSKASSDLQNSSSFFSAGHGFFPEPFSDFSDSFSNFGPTFSPLCFEMNAEEQQAPSFGSSFRLPPGLENMYDPEETEMRIAVAKFRYPEIVESAWSRHYDQRQFFDVHLACDAPGLAPPAFAYDAPGLPPPPQYEAYMPDMGLQSRPLPQPPLQHQPFVATQPPLFQPPMHAPLQPNFSTHMQRDYWGGELLSFPPPEAPMHRAFPEMVQRCDEHCFEFNGAQESQEWPSIGSQDHVDGNCKPCAFYHRKGCGSGSMCRFCHICDSGEKKKRLKEKRDVLRSATMS
jgi:hypothetical protein